MAELNESSFKNSYKGILEIGLQQYGSLLKNTVTEDSLAGEQKFFDRVESVEAREKTAVNQQVIYNPAQHKRRKCIFRDFYWSDLVDRTNIIKLMLDPASEYSRNGVMALGRQLDQLILNAAVGVAYEGKNGTDAVSFDTDQEIAVGYVDSGSETPSNLTVAKLREARKILKANNAIQMGEKITCVISAEQEQALLRDDKVTSSDYNAVKALVHGEVNTFLGMTFVVMELLPSSATNVRDCLVYTDRAIKLGMAKDIGVELDKIPQQFNANQVLATLQADASRMFEESVVKIFCNETK